LGEKEDRHYRLIQTVVRRIKDETPAAPPKSEKAKPNPSPPKK